MAELLLLGSPLAPQLLLLLLLQEKLLLLPERKLSSVASHPWLADPPRKDPLLVPLPLASHPPHLPLPSWRMSPVNGPRWKARLSPLPPPLLEQVQSQAMELPGGPRNLDLVP